MLNRHLEVFTTFTMSQTLVDENKMGVMCKHITKPVPKGAQDEGESPVPGGTISLEGERYSSFIL